MTMIRQQLLCWCTESFTVEFITCSRLQKHSTAALNKSYVSQSFTIKTVWTSVKCDDREIPIRIYCVINSLCKHPWLLFTLRHVILESSEFVLLCNCTQYFQYVHIQGKSDDNLLSTTFSACASQNLQDWKHAFTRI